ncbi:uncharacterized protein LOC116622658 isoform X4 [Phoca vitulina]|uniref:uncharacterized protein LOC116622658 isoform X4 n=1 Tax=Phoca vitulina TaxID=9720 RepID=UPI0013962EC6|nr:uncharacterized protein LOC116622658 isoform X4 [Phoca vitulina]
MVTLLSGSLCASHTLVSLGMSDFIAFGVTEKPCCQGCAGNVGSRERFGSVNARPPWPVSSFPSWNEDNWPRGARNLPMATPRWTSSRTLGCKDGSGFISDGSWYPSLLR